MKVTNFMCKNYELRFSMVNKNAYSVIPQEVHVENGSCKERSEAVEENDEEDSRKSFTL